MRGPCHRRVGETTLRGRALPSHALPQRPPMFLPAPLSSAAGILHCGQREQRLRYGKLATSARVQRPWNPIRALDELTPTVVAVMVLFAVVNVTIFLKLGRLTLWTHISDDHDFLLTSAGLVSDIGQQ